MPEPQARCGETGQRCWYVLKTEPYKEHYVQYQLRDLGIETYFPLLKTFRKYLRKGQRQIQPFFPGYVFVRLDLGMDLFQLRRVREFNSLVSFDGRPAQLEPRIIEDFRRRESGKGYICLRPSQCEWQLNQAVEIVEGIFAGHTGLFARYLESTQRVCVLLNILRPHTIVELPLSSVSASPSSPGYHSRPVSS